LKTNVSWQELYAAAMLELDRAQLPGKIEAAQSAIKQAMEELAIDGRLGTVEDAQFMTDALRNLSALERLEFANASPTAGPGQRQAEG
jgi:hypothetical protein